MITPLLKFGKTNLLDVQVSIETADGRRYMRTIQGKVLQRVLGKSANKRAAFHSFHRRQLPFPKC